MSSPPVQEPEPAAASRRPWWRRLIVVGAVVATLAVGLYVYLDYAWQQDLREAVAEADRLDPGWRLEDLERARPPVPDDENGAALVKAARAQMPGRWLAVPGGGDVGLEDRLAALPPTRLPDEADLKSLRDTLGKVAAALDVARELADRPRGRYAVNWSNDYVGTRMLHLDEVREVTRLLALDALRRSLEGDTEGALRSCRAALNAGRSVGDEPVTISQLIRLSCTGQAVRALERALAHGEAAPKSLEQMQRALAEEAEEPLQLISARSDRVSYYQCLEVMRARKFNRASYGLRSSLLGSTGDDLIDAGRARQCEVAYLHYSNELVEIAKLPTEAQEERLKPLAPPRQQLPALLDGLTRGDGDWSKLATAFHRGRAELRCAAAALAAERYRLAEGRWPDRLEALVPRYLAAVPADPFDGQPLRLRRLPDGIVIYAVGPDGTDDGGNLDRKRPTAPGTDVGFQLWDVKQRGAPPAPK
jgi:hypothetical protein